jgi:hypothetical protein
MIEAKTRELPLMSAADTQTAPIQLSADQTAEFTPEQVALLPPPPDLPRPHNPATGEMHTAQLTPRAVPFPAPPAATPPPFEPAVAHAAPNIAPEVVAARPARRPRRWPLALGSWFGGVLAGMLVLMLGLMYLGGPGDVAANTGDTAAAWDTSITLTDAYLTAQARKNGAAQVQEPTMRVQADGTIAMQGKVNLPMLGSAQVNGVLQPTIVDGKLKMQIVSMNVGALPLPEFVVTQIQNNMATSAQPPAMATSTTIVKLEASEGKLVIYGKLQ